MKPDLTPYYGTIPTAPAHGVALNAITQRMFSRKVRTLRFYDAMTSIALAAEIHGTDAAVLKALWRALPRVQPDKQPLLLAMMNAPSPLAHVRQIIDTLPASFLEADIRKMNLAELQQAIGIAPADTTEEAPAHAA